MSADGVTRESCGKCLALIVVLALLPLVVATDALGRRGVDEVARPVLLPGDAWTLRWTERNSQLDGPGLAGKITSGVYTQVVVGRIRFRGQPAYLLRRDDGTYDVWRLDLWEVARLYETRKPGAIFSVKATSPFPLRIGRTFTREWANTLIGYRGRFSYRVARVERIRTPTGRLRAFRVNETGSIDYEGRKSRETGYSYYAPAAKRFVVQHIETDSGYRFHAEVVDYSVRRGR